MSNLILLLISAAFLCVAAIVAHFFLLQQEKQKKSVVLTKSHAEGSPRYIYQILYALILWSAMSFWFPMLVTYREKLAGVANSRESILLAGKLLLLPLLVLLLLLYGLRRGYLQWIKNIHWPNDEH